MGSLSLTDIASGSSKPEYSGLPVNGGDEEAGSATGAPSGKAQQPTLLRRSGLWLVRIVAAALLLALLACSIWMLAHHVFYSSSESISTAPSPCASQTFNGTESAMHTAIRAQVAQGFAGASSTGGIVMFGASTASRYDTDVELLFRQESNFLYLTGYAAADARLLFDLVSGATTLFIPQRPVDYAVWNGAIEDPAAIAAKYGFTSVAYDRDFADVLRTTASRTPGYVVYVMPGDAARVPSSPAYTTNSAKLRDVLYASRTNKTPLEIEVLRIASNVSSEAHIAVMQRSRAGLYEYNLQSTFEATCLDCGLLHQAYLPIVGSGNNSAILHYIANDKLMKPGQLVLVDAGAEFRGYASDITRTFPVDGCFTAVQKEIYEMVLRIQVQLISLAKPGYTFASLFSVAAAGVCSEMISGGYILGTQDQCVSNRVYSLFLPHGVSHYLGLDVHDRSSPTKRLLATNDVITIEPGIYFNAALLQPAFTNPTWRPYLAVDRNQKMLNDQFGGVRIEDDLLITADGNEVLSLAPKTVHEIELTMRCRR